MNWSIIMLTMNKKGRAIQSLAHVRHAIAALGEKVELVVVDNNSSDGLREWLEEQDDILPVCSPFNIGVPRARNAGIAVSSGRNILFLDSDVDLHDRALPLLSAALEPEHAGMAGDAAGMFIPEWVKTDTWGHDLPDGDYPGTNFIVGYCMAIPRRILNEVGPFDEDFPPYYWEDVDYGVRVRKAGKSLVVVPDCCYHYGHTSVSSQWTKKQISEVEKRGIQRMLKKHDQDCPEWALVKADNSVSWSNIQSLKDNLDALHPNNILHICGTEFESKPPWFLCHPVQKYADHLYSRICRWSGCWVIDGHQVPERDEAVAAVTSPVDRRRF